MLQRAAGLLLRTAQQTSQASVCSTSGRLFAAAAESTPKPNGSKSMLDMAAPLTSSNVLSEADLARLAGAANAAAAGAAAGADAAGAEGPAARSALQKVASALWDLTLVGVVGATGAAAYYYRYDTSELQKMVDEKKRTEADSQASMLWVDGIERFISMRKQAERKVREYTDPSCDKLLPDLPPELRGRVKTIVLDLEDVLVHREWTRAKGWSIFKRPGAADFILQVAPYFELVVYTDEQNMYADPIINKLDQQRAIPYRLYRQDTQYVDGKHVRDLSKLNRDLSQVLFISANPDAYSFQPENAIKLKPWHGDAKDTTLLDLIPMLQMIYLTQVKDVRDVVRSYDTEEDVAKAFKTRMQQINEAHKQQSKGLFRLR